MGASQGVAQGGRLQEVAGCQNPSRAGGERGFNSIYLFMWDVPIGIHVRDVIVQDVLYC